MSSTVFNQTTQQLLLDIMQSRRDVRGNHFSNQAVNDELILCLLEAAMTAPSVGLSEPWEFIVVKDYATRARIVENFSTANRQATQQFNGSKKSQYEDLKLEGIIESAFNIAVFYNPPDEPVLGQNSMKDVGRFSVVCAIQNLWLMARAHNIGLGWVSILDPENVKQELNVPDSHELIGYLCLGYVKEFLDRPELEVLKWKKRRQRSAAIHFERYGACNSSAS